MEKLFDFRINYSDLPQGFAPNPNLTSDFVTLYPNACCDIHILKSTHELLTPIKNFLFEVNKKKARKIYLQRTFSLGDVLALVPVVRYLKMLHYKPYIRTLPQYHEILNYLGIKYQSVDESTEHHGIILDWQVELERIDLRLSYFHRVNLYATALGLKGVENFDWNWGCELEKLPKFDFDLDTDPYVIFQGKGSLLQKSLDNKVIGQLIRAMNLDGIRVVYIGEVIEEFEDIDERMTKFLFKTRGLLELFSWIARAKCLLCMDSGPLWISHFTRTPLVAILGPTRPEERISFHPLYPEGATAVQLNKEINCESCIERAEACGGKISCFRQKSEKIYKLIRPYLLRYWEL